MNIRYNIGSYWATSSKVERLSYMQLVPGSSPGSPTQ